MRWMKLMAAGVLAAGTGCGGGESLGGLNAERSFNVALTAAEEVPAPKPTTASGTAVVIVYADEIEYQLSAVNITGITMAHIHNGAPGVAGPIVVTLFQPTSATGAVNGVFASGTLNATNLPPGVTMASLKALLLSGSAYVNVHTTNNQPGEIRGQLD
jgi:hypothetical protein